MTSLTELPCSGVMVVTKCLDATAQRKGVVGIETHYGVGEVVGAVFDRHRLAH